jgi:hypothetical protein
VKGLIGLPRTLLSAIGGWIRIWYEMPGSFGIAHRHAPDYVPPPDWIVQCPGAEYAFLPCNHNVRLSYEVTPITGRTVTLIAQVAYSKGTLTSIVDRFSMSHFAILVWGEQEPHALLAARLKTDQTEMVIWWLLLLIAAAGWMYVLLRESLPQSRPARVVAVTWRGAIIAAPFVGLFAVADLGILITATLAAAVAAVVLGYLLSRPSPAKPR